jgi:hypothetical protein
MARALKACTHLTAFFNKIGNPSQDPFTFHWTQNDGDERFWQVRGIQFFDHVFLICI